MSYSLNFSELLMINVKVKYPGFFSIFHVKCVKFVNKKQYSTRKIRFISFCFKESSSEHLLSHHTTLQRQQQEVFSNLQKINATVFHITASVSNLQIYLEQRIAWITQLLGGAGKICIVTYFFLH